MPKRFRIHLPSPRAIWAAITSRRLLLAIKAVIVRTYALGILALLILGGYYSVHYLVRTVFFPPGLPAPMQDWAAKLDVAELRSNQAEGVERTAPRAPISHYHTVDQWFQTDSGNGCTPSGCHQPLPHDHRAKVAAFANFHTTFLSCRMCHSPPTDRPAATKWVNTSTMQVQDSPAILQLLQYMELNADTIASQPVTADLRIKDLLQQSIKVLGQDEALDELLAEMQSSQPGSPVWKRAVSELILELPLHARGEYRAKLQWSTDADQREAQFSALKDQARQYLAAAPDSQDRRDLKQTIHKSLATAPTACVTCHDDQPAMLDFKAAGYSPKRTTLLSHLEIARLMQQVREGQNFFLPNMQEGGQ
jgi:hypothetical protein